MSFLYYFPGREIGLTKNQFAEADKKHGLDSVLRDANMANLQTLRGPDDGQGFLSMIDRPEFSAVNLGYDITKQTWKKASDHHWLGWWNDRKPTPELLKRPKTIDGELIEINGGQWLIPVCGPLRSKLPFDFVMAMDGEWQPEVDEEYRDLMKMCDQSMTDSENGKASGADVDGIFKRHMAFCCRLLAVNYHLGPSEISILRLLKKSSFGELLNTAWGLTTIDREEQAKKEEAARVASS